MGVARPTSQPICDQYLKCNDFKAHNKMTIEIFNLMFFNMSLSAEADLRLKTNLSRNHQR